MPFLCCFLLFFDRDRDQSAINHESAREPGGEAPRKLTCLLPVRSTVVLDYVVSCWGVGGPRAKSRRPPKEALVRHNHPFFKKLEKNEKNVSFFT